MRYNNNMIKILAKRLASPKLWQNLRILRKYWNRRKKYWHETFPLKQLALFLKVAAKDIIKTTAPLDYAALDIYMDIESPEQLLRLNACHKEPETVNWIESRLKPNDIFYDIGANVGAYSFIAWAKTKGQCKAFAFEPSFSTFAALNKNIILNHATRCITPIFAALGEKTEMREFHYQSLDPGAASHFPEKPAASILMLNYSLDDFINIFGIPPPTHIKLDVDGFELEIIKGAKTALKNPSLKSILIEINEALPTHQEILMLLESAGLKFCSKHRRLSKVIFNYIFTRY